MHCSKLTFSLIIGGFILFHLDSWATSPPSQSQKLISNFSSDHSQFYDLRQEIFPSLFQVLLELIKTAKSSSKETVAFSALHKCKLRYLKKILNHLKARSFQNSLIKQSKYSSFLFVKYCSAYFCLFYNNPPTPISRYDEWWISNITITWYK